MRKSISNKEIIEVSDISNFRVNSAKSFLKLWMNPVRRKWLVDSYDHTFGSYSYQFINSPIGDIRKCINHLAGKQIFVHQLSINNVKCPRYAILNKFFIYQQSELNNVQWIYIVNIEPKPESEPIFMVKYRKIYQYVNVYLLIDYKFYVFI